MSARIGRVFSVTVTTALYRRYRPDSFADVIGQEHVTEPLMTALRKNRVNHAYLFSGPRGCGKTTSARILARCLNCAQGPTDTPCGTCSSCVELARGGSGSLDVIEIDAASHGGVDDARDLRERATYAPVRDRYKIFIIDEAHMVTSAGFNALLKIVEEPPEHIKFIFATTEPDKVIGTIRSRTHHYPFRLVPPEPLMAYLELLCRQENVPVAPGVLSLVIRAGGGSVRDSLSVLDQLMAGAGPNGLDYELAVALLGYTHASLLDDVVEAVAASDAATVFRAVDRVIQTGHDPRRFVEDLLERFRDLIIVQAMPESAHAILRGMPADQIARLQNQAHNLGAAELSRAADVTNTALTEMTGATSPRLHLELLCARILLPSSEQNERGMAARIDRVERRLNYTGNDVTVPAAQGAPGAAVPAAAPAATPGASLPELPHAPVTAGPSGQAAPQPPSQSATVTGGPSGQAEPPSQTAAARPASAESMPGASAPAQPTADGPRSQLTPPRVSTNDWPIEEAARVRTPDGFAAAGTGQAATQSSAAASPDPANRPSPGIEPAGAAAPPSARQEAPAAPAPAAPPAMGDVEVLRRAWPDVLQALSKIKRSTWALVEPNAQVSAFDGSVVTLSFTTQGLAGAFGRADHADNLRQAIHKTVGIDCQINAVAGGTSQASAEPNPKVPASPVVPATSADVAWGLAPAPAQPASPSQASAAAGSPAAPASGNSERPTTARSSTTAQSSPGGGGSGSSAVAASPGAAPEGTPAAATSPATRPADENLRGHQDAKSLQPGAQGMGPAASGSGADAGQSPYPSAGGDYSYSDDDWGPPRDEDAPPLDEEPPMDWEPSTRPGNRTAPSSPSAGSGQEAPGSRSKPAARPQGAATGGSATDTVALPVHQNAGPAHDPWARAVEQAPGVWVVGDKSNIGANPAPGSVPDNIGTQANVPHYAPATAQVPPTIPVAPAAKAAAAAAPGWGPGSNAASGPGAASGAGPGAPGAEKYQVLSPDRVPAPEFAMASAAPATVARSTTAQAPAPQSPAAQPTVAQTTVAQATVTQSAVTQSTVAPSRPQTPAAAPAAGQGETRQSLYQRLSNSPEAEAGRAKAPARAAAAPSAFIQDVPSADDETIEESGVFGRAAVERILGGKLIEERSVDGSPVTPRY
ncbi:DNA polymerase III subunit gamma and tau [Pseudarthrobacter sp. BRE9]|uniref:DNA polymerase III subunit gamma and tau n=1 Tax=Pseudarthrobacter sp. BRE9 TaxID=2962582 RepID=UPI0028820E92|nr:DNA polymerase III subunit gamma and tau [Pseudarthrobacter sp. BRE9]MDT0170703.1 DNA polymerase III subunit gamma and tau [Pseudarthrobacter sp. BRE9]